MAQVKGRLRLLTTRFSSDRVGRVKYSMLCPSRIDSPCAARRAMPMSLGLSESGGRGKVDIFAFCSPIVTATGGRCQEGKGIGDRAPQNRPSDVLWSPDRSPQGRN